MNFNEINSLLKTQLGSNVISGVHQADGLMPFVSIAAEKLVAVCEFLYTSPETYFDYLSCLTGTDNGPEASTMEVVYNLYSIPFNTSYCIKVVLPRPTESHQLPAIDSISHVWRSANWHEREVYDLLGIHFNNHPDLRRILLPANWEGHPLRKDYQVQEYYHGIQVKY